MSTEYLIVVYDDGEVRDIVEIPEDGFKRVIYDEEMKATFHTSLGNGVDHARSIGYPLSFSTNRPDRYYVGQVLRR